MRAPRRGMAAAGGAGDDHQTTQIHQKVPTQTDGRGSSRNARVAAVLSGPGFPLVMVCLIVAGFVVSLVTETAELHGAGRGGDGSVSGDPSASGRLVSMSPGVTRHGHLQCLGWQGLTPVPRSLPTCSALTAVVTAVDAPPPPPQRWMLKLSVRGNECECQALYGCSS